MITTYAVNTTGQDLTNNYSFNHLTSGWEMGGSGPSGDREYVETWTFRTAASSIVERMLDQEPDVLNYYVIAEDDDAQPDWY